MLNYWIDNPLKKVFRDAEAPDKPKREISLKLGHNESEDAQIVVKSNKDIKSLSFDTEPLEGSNGIVIPAKNIRCNFVGWVPVGFNTYNTEDSELVRKAPDLFPDPLLEETDIRLGRDIAQSIWVTVTIDEQIPAGEYKGNINVSADSQKISIPVNVTVWPITLPKKTRLWMTNWVEEEALVRWYKPERFTPKYWELLETVACNLAEHHQNCILTPLFLLIKITKDGGKYVYDYTNFDRWVNVFDRYGVADMIHGGHIASRIGPGGETQYSYNGFTVNFPDGSKIFLPKVPVPDKDREAMLSDFFTNLIQHLRKNDWLKRFAMHIADEPNIHNFKTYRPVCDFIKRVMPEVRRIDAVLDTRMQGYDIDGCLEIRIPQIQEIGDDKCNRSDKEELWFYTCLAPQGRYPNRFIDFTLLKVRIMHWLNWRYKAPGYLHWGYCHWMSGEGNENYNPWENTTSDSEIFSPERLKLPPGDPFVVYPGKNGICNSIRWETIRRGVEDYEYLMMLEDRAASGGAGSKECGKLLEEIKVKIVKSHSEFTRNEEEIIAMKEKIVEHLL